uniref:Kunitz-type serine protease inhibitor IX n=1 Tax=Bungarus fasciatus TaxID=8613 RepID=VKT9_BUNFA|nr:RecName: Full=Kunitz-type serine protease inhibitor IX; AltName: Full=Bungarus fasciatus fraction IX; Short=BF9; AltName: Full=Venom basic protease inhibitor IX; Contains: RecName: Full=Kunitz-type serine protease inhibitor VIIIB; AltName: Full=Venom basic protease inhibitor VIIIB [Bungarus fasciatus]1JC6_A Chain A, VENOM BASIC PROTEASE INHIBITORS IX AND VIIIB [Bungarus fasciatus]
KNRPTFCNLLPETGRCNALIPAFYYNSHLHKCQKFNYGGCGGNANNFKTIDECQRTCAAKYGRSS